MTMLKEITRQLHNAIKVLDKSKIKMEKDDKSLDVLMDYLRVKDMVNDAAKYAHNARSDEKYFNKLNGKEEELDTTHKNLASQGVTKEFNTLKDTIKDVLERHPETRDSDTVLYFTILQEMGADTLEEAKYMNVNLISIHKARQVIQNKEGLFPPTADIKIIRAKREQEIRDYMRKQ